MRELEESYIVENKIITNRQRVSKFAKFLKYLKFFLIPSYRIRELTKKEIVCGKKRSARRLKRLFKSRLTIIGMFLVIFILSIAVFCPWISPYTYQEAMGSFPGEWSPPSDNHPLGQSNFGLDVLSRILWGTRFSLIVALGAVSISIIFGTVIGLMAAYYGKWIDLILMRIMEIIMAFPGIVLVITIMVIITPQSFISLTRSIINLILLFGLVGIPYFSRLIRGSVLQARELNYINGARVSGASNYRIMFKHILPNCLQPIIISISFKIGSIIISLAVISFIGFSDTRIINWGLDIGIARLNLKDAPWAILAPSFMILITVLGFVLLGDGLREVFDPRSQIL